MAKIIRFPSENQNMVDELEKIIELAKQGNIKNYVFAAELQGEDEGVVATAYFNADLGTRQLLNSHIQVDIMAGMVEVNFCDE